MTHAGCRISRVRPKGRGLAEVIILRPERDKHREIVLSWVADTLDRQIESRNIAGFAFVVWDERKQAMGMFQSYRAGIGPAEGPDFVRSVLQTYHIDERAKRLFPGYEDDNSA